MTKSLKKQKAERKGRLAEHIIAWLYRLQGYRLLERRYRCRYGEIDLIMQRGEVRVFVEVKYRSYQRGGEALPEDTFPSPRQQNRIRRAAEYFLARHAGRVDLPCRFDLAVSCGLKGIRFYRNAF